MPSGTAERFSDANWTGRRSPTGSLDSVPAMTVPAAIEVETSVCRLPCQTAGTETGCRTTSGDVAVVGGANKSWSFMSRVTARRVPVQTGSRLLGCASVPAVRRRLTCHSGAMVVSSERHVVPDGQLVLARRLLTIGNQPVLVPMECSTVCPAAVLETRPEGGLARLLH